MHVTIIVRVTDYTDPQFGESATGHIIGENGRPWTTGWRDLFSKIAEEALTRYNRTARTTDPVLDAAQAEAR